MNVLSLCSLWGVHSAVYWATKIIGHTVPLKHFETFVSNRRKLREITVDTLMYNVLIAHGVVALSYSFNFMSIFDKHAEEQMWLVSHIVLELCYYCYDFLEMLLKPVACRADFVVHHVLAISLLLTCYMSNLMTFGVYLSTMLNITNLPLSLFRLGYISNSISFRFTSSLFFLCAFVYVRILTFLDMIVNDVFLAHDAGILTPGESMVILPSMVCLFALQFVWALKLISITVENGITWYKYREFRQSMPDYLKDFWKPSAGAVMRLLKDKSMYENFQKHMLELPPLEDDVTTLQGDMQSLEERIRGKFGQEIEWMTDIEHMELNSSSSSEGDEGDEGDTEGDSEDKGGDEGTTGDGWSDDEGASHPIQTSSDTSDPFENVRPQKVEEITGATEALEAEAEAEAEAYEEFPNLTQIPKSLFRDIEPFREVLSQNQVKKLREFFSPKA